MRGISPIISTILMIAIAIAAAVVVYYITMDVLTKQGTQLEESATTQNPTVIIQAATLETNGDNDLNTVGTEDNLVIYYTISNSAETNAAKLGTVSVYILDDQYNAICQVPEENLVITTGEIALKKATITTCNQNVKKNTYYYLKLSAGPATSNLYRIKAQ